MTNQDRWEADERSTYTFDQEQMDRVHNILARELIEIGVNLVMLIDTAGNIIATLDNGRSQHDVYSLAALAAGNFGAVSTMARMLGEEEFSLLFHKGTKENIHFSKVGQDFLLIVIFDNKTSLGFVRLKAADANEKLVGVLEG